MSLWSKLRKWYEPKFRITNYDTYPFETEEIPSSPLARFTRTVVKHRIEIITSVGVVFTIIAAIYTVRAFYAIPQTQPQSEPAKPSAHPKKEVSNQKSTKANDDKFYNQHLNISMPANPTTQKISGDAGNLCNFLR